MNNEKYHTLMTQIISNNLMSILQDMSDLVSDIAQAPVAVIMPYNTFKIEMAVVSEHFSDRVHTPLQKDTLIETLNNYRLIDSHEIVEITHKSDLKKYQVDPQFGSNIKSYYGIPIFFPNGDLLGCLCVVDIVERQFGPRVKRLMNIAKKTIESSIPLLHDYRQKCIDKDQLTHDLNIKEQLNNYSHIPTQHYALKRSVENNQPYFFVLFICTSQALNIRDNLGLLSYQQLSQAFYTRIKNVIPESSILYHINNFELVITHATTHPDSLKITSKNISDTVQEFFKTPFEVNGKKIQIPVNIGCALSYDDSFSFTEVLDMASVACTQGIETGIKFHIFNATTQEERKRHYDISQLFLPAFHKSEFYLNYQPIISAQTQKIVGIETLVRWDNDLLGMIFPDEFIPIAEQSGRINQLGNFIILKALKQFSRWRKRYNTDIYISINISSIQLYQRKFSNWLIEQIQYFNLPTEAILLEVTETALIDNEELVHEHLNRLSNFGLKIALDDFGTGFSSLSHLQDFPISVVKIDKNFIFNINNSKKAVKIVKGVISLSKMMGLKVIAEGVEDEQTYQILYMLKCDYMQGYHWSRPLSAEDFESRYLVGDK